MKQFHIHIIEFDDCIRVAIYGRNQNEKINYIEEIYDFNKKGRDPIERILMFIKKNIKDLKE